MQNKILGFLTNNTGLPSNTPGRSLKALLGLSPKYSALKGALKSPLPMFKNEVLPKDVMRFVSNLHGDSALHKIDKSTQTPSARISNLVHMSKILSDTDFEALASRKNSEGQVAFSTLKLSSQGPLKETLAKKVQMGMGHLTKSMTSEEIMSFKDTRTNENFAHKMLGVIAEKPVREVRGELDKLKKVIGDDNFARLMLTANKVGHKAVDLVQFNYGPEKNINVSETEHDTGQYYGLNQVVTTFTTTSSSRELDLDSKLMNLYLSKSLGAGFKPMEAVIQNNSTLVHSNEAECISYH